MLSDYGAPRLVTAAGGKPYSVQDRTANILLVSVSLDPDSNAGAR